MEQLTAHWTLGESLDHGTPGRTLRYEVRDSLGNLVVDAIDSGVCEFGVDSDIYKARREEMRSQGRLIASAPALLRQVVSANVEDPSNAVRRAIIRDAVEAYGSYDMQGAVERWKRRTGYDPDFSSDDESDIKLGVEDHYFATVDNMADVHKVLHAEKFIQQMANPAGYDHAVAYVVELMTEDYDIDLVANYTHAGTLELHPHSAGIDIYLTDCNK